MADLENNKGGRPSYDINDRGSYMSEKINKDINEKRENIKKEISESGKNTLTRRVLFEKHKKHSKEYIHKRTQRIK